METRVFKSERNTQIIIDKKFNIRKGDDVRVTYLKNDKEEISAATIEINGELIGKFDLEELEDFLTTFLAEPF